MSRNKHTPDEPITPQEAGPASAEEARAEPETAPGRTVRPESLSDAAAAAVASHDENQRRAALRTYSIPLEN